MEYAVVVCSKCRKAKAVVAGVKTSSCIYCGRNLKVDKLKVMYSSESSSEVARAAGLMNAKLAGGEDVYLEDVRRAQEKEGRVRQSVFQSADDEEDGLRDTPGKKEDGDPFYSGESIGLQKRDQRNGQEAAPTSQEVEGLVDPSDIQFRMAAIAKTLTEKFGTFTLENFVEVAKKLGIPEQRAEKGLDAMRKLGIVYEPTHGRFARVDE